jgi:hypothetical protein
LRVGSVFDRQCYRIADSWRGGLSAAAHRGNARDAAAGWEARRILRVFFIDGESQLSRQATERRYFSQQCSAQISDRGFRRYFDLNCGTLSELLGHGEQLHRYFHDSTPWPQGKSGNGT